MRFNRACTTPDILAHAGVNGPCLRGVRTPSGNAIAASAWREDGDRNDRGDYIGGIITVSIM
jgi:hypothetical protein